MIPTWARELVPTGYADVFIDEGTGLFVTIEPRTDRTYPNFTIWTAPSGGNVLVSASLMHIGPLFHYYQDTNRGLEEHIRFQRAVELATGLMEAMIRDDNPGV